MSVLDLMMGKMRMNRQAAGDPYASMVTSLLHFDGANNSTVFTDETGLVWTPSTGAKISTANPKFGTGSGVTSGSGAIRANVPTAQQIGTQDFTMEFWHRPIATVQFATIFESRIGSGTALVVYGQNGVTGLTYYNGVAGNAITTSALTVGLYEHFALQRKAGIAEFFKSGVSQGTIADTNTYAHTIYQLLNNTGNGNPLAGTMDDWRLTVGKARYVGPFTPPTGPFTYP